MCDTAAEGSSRVVLFACSRCGALRGYPRPLCAVCAARETEQVTLPLEGRVYSITTIYRAPSLTLAQQVPYAIGLVEGLRGGLLLLPFQCDAQQLPLIGDTVFIQEGKGPAGQITLVASRQPEPRF